MRLLSISPPGGAVRAVVQVWLDCPIIFDGYVCESDRPPVNIVDYMTPAFRCPIPGQVNTPTEECGDRTASSHQSGRSHGDEGNNDRARTIDNVPIDHDRFAAAPSAALKL